MWSTRPLGVAVALQIILVCMCAGTLLVEEPTPSPPLQGVPLPLSGSFNSRLNHFDATNTEQFSIRFFYQPHPDFNLENSTDHILVLVGGPWAIRQEWLQSGLILDLTTSLGNLTSFYVEHRFYGNSRPSGDTSLQNLQYLTTDQVLGDIAHFTSYVRSDDFEDGIYKNANITLIGCSMGGSIATWMKLGYPHLVNSVVSDSGPLLAKGNFTGFLSKVSSTITNVGGVQCTTAIEEALASIRTQIKTANGRTSLSTLFNTCTALTEDVMDISTFYWYGIIEFFANLVLNAAPGDIETACDSLTTGQGDNLNRLAQWVRSQNTESCVQTSHAARVQQYQQTDGASPNQRRLWLYQICSQYGWQLNTIDSYFFDTITDDFFTRQCSDVFGAEFTPSFRQQGIVRTNTFFGGLRKIPDHVVTATAGPWAEVCPSSDHERRPLAPVHSISRVGQCHVIRSLSESQDVFGLEQIHSTKVAIQNQLLLWVRDIDNNSSNIARLANSLIFAMVAFAVFRNYVY